MTCVVKHKSKEELRRCVGTKLKHKDDSMYPEFVKNGRFAVWGLDLEGKYFWATVVNKRGLIKKIL